MGAGVVDALGLVGIFQLALPDEKALAAELKETRRQLDARRN
jgi:hypothetical protein